MSTMSVNTETMSLSTGLNFYPLFKPRKISFGGDFLGNDIFWWMIFRLQIMIFIFLLLILIYVNKK